MHIVIDRQALKMVAAASNMNWADLIASVDFKDVPTVVFDGQLGRSWTVLSELELKMLYKNMSGQDSPDYQECIKQLREYSESWSNYHKTEAQLQKEYNKLEYPDDYQASVQMGIQAYTRQANFDIGNQMARDHSAVAPLADSPKPTTQPKAAKPASEASAPRKPGATKMVWDICDVEFAKPGMQAMQWKEFREIAKNACLASGINEGTFGVQFGKWKSTKVAS